MDIGGPPPHPSPATHPPARPSPPPASPVHANIALLPGDGIGPEIVAQAARVLRAVADRFGHTFTLTEHPVGGAAIDAHGDPLPPATLDACRAADAVLLGGVGGPKWDDPDAAVRPEQGLLRVRKELGLFANLRPIKPLDALVEASPLKTDIVRGTDILFVRELTGGVYFGASGRRDNGRTAYQEMVYTEDEVARIVRVAAGLARDRGGRLTSVDKANVLEPSRLWRSVCTRVVAEEFPDVTLEHVLVDAMAMHLIARPGDFSTVVTGNLFGDILTDAGSMLPGSLGMLPSASLGDGTGPGLFEPAHGTAPDIAGTGKANPLATILSAAMLLRDGLKLPAEAAAVESAVHATVAAGARTADIAGGGASVGTVAVTDAVLERLRL